jgi:hypothetical protein
MPRGQSRNTPSTFVRDTSRQALEHRRAVNKRFTKGEARRMAINFASCRTCCAGRRR